MMMLNCKQLKSFLEFLRDYESHILQTLPIKDINAKYKLMLSQTQARIYELYSTEWSLNIDEDSLKILCRMRLYIERLTSTLEQESKKCEILYFKLLSHFYYGKTVEEACNLVETNYKQGFFEEVISFHCDCLDKSFIMHYTSNSGFPNAYHTS